MAIARKIDPAALARAFADELHTVPEIKRVWYRFRPNTTDPERMGLDFDIQLERESADADKAIMAALNRLQAEYSDELYVGGFQFSLTEDDLLTLDDLVGPDLVEIPLHGA
jgi:hypothetical protein